MSALRTAVQRFGDEVAEAFDDNPFVVFLCGPSLKPGGESPAARLRRRLQNDLSASKFSVVLGEDDGLEWLRTEFKGLADDNEVTFIKKCAGAVVVVAGSCGSFCEIGLFSHVCSPQRSDSNYKGDLILIADRSHEEDQSYFNCGPAKSVETCSGKLFYTDFDTFDTSLVIKRLEPRRAVWVNRRIREQP